MAYNYYDFMRDLATTKLVATGQGAAAAALNPNAAKYIGESASYIARGGAPEAKSSGSTLGGILKTVATIAVPVIAAVAAPYLAPVIGSALAATGLASVGSALGLGGLGAGLFGVPAAATSLGAGLTGSALGAGLGAGVGALTGRGALTGALIGGVGGGIGAYGGLGPALGFEGPGTVAPAYVTGAAGSLAVPTFGTAAGGTGAGATGTLATTAGTLGAGAAGSGLFGTLGSALSGVAGSLVGGASAGLSSTIGNLANQLVGGITTGGLADLATTMYNKPLEGLTPEERAAVNETAQLAQTNKDLFKQRVEQANMLWNAAQANPEKAYAEAVAGTQRGLREAQRRYGTGQYGGSGSERRQAGLARAGSIEAQRAGSTAAAAETEQATREMAAAAGMTPTTAPEGAASATLPIYQGAEKRQTDYKNQLARATGALFPGSIYRAGANPQSAQPSPYSVSYAR